MARNLLLLFLLPSLLFAGASDFAVTSPLYRTELRWFYQSYIDDSSSNFFILRGDYIFALPSNWSFIIRSNLPYVWLRAFSTLSIIDEFGEISETPTDQLIVENGLGDYLTHFIFVTPPIHNFTFTFGSQFIFPTASHLSLGAGKYISLPTLGIRYNFNDVMKGLWAAVLFRYASDFAGQKKRNHISDLIIQPNLAFPLSDTWNLITDPDIIYNYMNKAWFVPINLAVVARFADHWIVALRYGKGLVTDNPVYDQEGLIRFGYFF